MANEAKPLGPGECDTETAAKLIMVTPMWLRKLSKDGFIKQIAKDRWSVIEVVQGHIRYLKDENRRATITKSVSRVQEARALEIEIKTKKEMRELLSVEDVEAFLSDTLGVLRTKLSGLPAACFREPEPRAVVEKQVDVLIVEIRDAIGRIGAAIAAREPVVLDPEEADA